MFCDKCGTQLADNAAFCFNCGNQIKIKKNKNIYIALILTFIFTGLGSIYAGNTKKGLILLITRISLSALMIFSSIFFVFSMIIWAYAFYEAYRDVQIANGHQNPKLLNDFKTWDKNNQIIALLIIGIILIVAVGGCVNILTMKSYSHSDSATHYHSSSSGSGSSSSSSSHYGGVDTSPNTIARNDPDWYYDHYEYGDNPQIDDYLESQGYD